AEVVPFLTKPVSSRMRTPSASPSLSATYVCRSSRMSSAFQVAPFSSRCRPSGVRWPACSCSCQPLFAADRAEQGADVVTHAASQVGAAETVADAQEEVVEFMAPGRVGKVVEQ
ncbi:hypothetical protein ADK87_05475, partial [Streptomyces sp. NRRL F-4711]